MPKIFEQSLIIIQGAATEPMTPTLIVSTDTFTIPADTQVLFVVPCRKDGTMVIDGYEVILD